MERENLSVDVNGETASGLSHEGESTDAALRGGLFGSNDERCNDRGASEQAIHVGAIMGQLATGGARWSWRRAAALI